MGKTCHNMPISEHAMAVILMNELTAVTITCTGPIQQTTPAAVLLDSVGYGAREREGEGTWKDKGDMLEVAQELWKVGLRFIV